MKAETTEDEPEWRRRPRAPTQASLCPSAHSIDRPWVTVYSVTKHEHRIDAPTARPPSRDSSAHPFPERGGGGGARESQDREYPRRTRFEGKARREIQKANFIVRPGEPRIR